MTNGPDVGDLNPEQIATVRQLARALKTVQTRAGLSLRDVERNARSLRGSRSTFSVMLKGERLPAKSHVEAFLRGCGLADGQIRPWLLAWERLASEPRTEASVLEVAGFPSGTGPIEVSSPRHRRGRPLGVTAAAVALVALVIWGAVRLWGQTEPQFTGEMCRADYQPVARAGVSVRPCIEASAGRVRMSVYIKALQPSGTNGKVTAYVWLTHRDTKAKHRESLHTCPISLPDDQQVMTCVQTFTPPAGGDYYTAASAQAGTDPLPPEWSPSYTGTQSPTLRWQS
jgi:hypothetical protein